MMEVAIKKDSFINSISNELNKKPEEVIKLLYDFCEKKGVEFEPQDNGEKLIFFINEKTGMNVFEVCLEAFVERNIKVLFFLNYVTLETIGLCENCGGEILDFEIFKNGTIHDTYKQCENCETKF